MLNQLTWCYYFIGNIGITFSLIGGIATFWIIHYSLKILEYKNPWIALNKLDDPSDITTLGLKAISLKNNIGEIGMYPFE